ncbi:hypothetical protein BHM03_00028938 [Ensete ventricosum]|nr:hypothetical protein BHM03_00028938 [Ensete ventricosum]
MKWKLVWMSGGSELDLGVGCWSPGEEGVVQLRSAADSCKKVGSGRFPTSAVRALAPPIYPAGYLRWVGHVGGPAVRGGDDLAARSAFVISFSPPREDLLEAPGEGVEDEVSHLTADSRSP